MINTDLTDHLEKKGLLLRKQICWASDYCKCYDEVKMKQQQRTSPWQYNSWLTIRNITDGVCEDVRKTANGSLDIE